MSTSIPPSIGGPGNIDPTPALKGLPASKREPAQQGSGGAVSSGTLDAVKVLNAQGKALQHSQVNLDPQSQKALERFLDSHGKTIDPAVMAPIYGAPIRKPIDRRILDRHPAPEPARMEMIYGSPLMMKKGENKGGAIEVPVQSIHGRRFSDEYAQIVEMMSDEHAKPAPAHDTAQPAPPDAKPHRKPGFTDSIFDGKTRPPRTKPFVIPPLHKEIVPEPRGGEAQPARMEMIYGSPLMMKKSGETKGRPTQLQMIYGNPLVAQQQDQHIR